MSFDIPTLDDSHQFGLALAMALLTDPDLSQGSFNRLWFKTLAGAVTDNHAHIASTYNDLLPDTASIDTTAGNSTSALARWGAITGKVQKGATPSSGNAALRAFGISGSTIPDGTQLISAGQLTFETVGSSTIGSNGQVDCNVAAISTGSATNLDAGTQLTFTATPTGVNDVAVLQVDLANGTDLEDPGAYRLRILSQLSSPAAGGRADDYVQFALEQTGIAAAFCYPERQGLGSVDLSALHAGSGNERLLLSGEVTALQTTLNGLIPVGVTFRVLTAFATTQDVEYTLIPDGGSTTVFDWDDTSPPTVLAWTAGTRTLQFSATRPADIAPGARISILPALGGGTGEEYVVESLSSTDSVVLESVPALAPANGDTVYAGGPLVQPVRAAIQALFDSLGTANPDATRYGNWEGNLDPGAIDTVSRDTVGVLRGTVVEPSSLVTAEDPAFPDDGTIALLIAGRILVHAQH